MALNNLKISYCLLEKFLGNFLNVDDIVLGFQISDFAKPFNLKLISIMRIVNIGFSLSTELKRLRKIVNLFIEVFINTSQYVGNF